MNLACLRSVRCEVGAVLTKLVKDPPFTDSSRLPFVRCRPYDSIRLMDRRHRMVGRFDPGARLRRLCDETLAQLNWLGTEGFDEIFFNPDSKERINAGLARACRISDEIARRAEPHPHDERRPKL